MCINCTPTRKAPWVKKNFGLDLPSADYPVEVYPGYVASIVVKNHLALQVCGTPGQTPSLANW